MKYLNTIRDYAVGAACAVGILALFGTLILVEEAKDRIAYFRR